MQKATLNLFWKALTEIYLTRKYVYIHEIARHAMKLRSAKTSNFWSNHYKRKSVFLEIFMKYFSGLKMSAEQCALSLDSYERRIIQSCSLHCWHFSRERKIIFKPEIVERVLNISWRDFTANLVQSNLAVCCFFFGKMRLRNIRNANLRLWNYLI